MHDSYGQPTFTYPLKYPFTVGGHEISAITIRRPRVADQIAASESKGSEVAKSVYFYARLTEHPKEVFEKLDYEKCLNLVKDLQNIFAMSPMRSDPLVHKQLSKMQKLVEEKMRNRHEGTNYTIKLY